MSGEEIQELQDDIMALIIEPVYNADTTRTTKSCFTKS
jgi:hypothetical protein